MSSEGRRSPVLVAMNGPVGSVILNRPAKRNALTLEMWGLVTDAVRRLETNSSVRVVVLRGVDDSAFAAGADISEFRERRTSPGDADRYNAVVREAERTLAECIKPTVAAIQGPCIGGGCELAVACDFRLSDGSGRFGITVARLGLVYGLAATRRLVAVIGPTMAKWMLFTGAIIDADEALNIGLVTKLLPAATFAQQADDFVRTLCSGSRIAQEGTKRLLAMTGDGAETAVVAERIVRQAYESDDYREGVTAFLEKRKPGFS